MKSRSSLYVFFVHHTTLPPERRRSIHHTSPGRPDCDHTWPEAWLSSLAVSYKALDLLSCPILRSRFQRVDVRSARDEGTLLQLPLNERKNGFGTWDADGPQSCLYVQLGYCPASSIEKVIH